MDLYRHDPHHVEPPGIARKFPNSFLGLSLDTWCSQAETFNIKKISVAFLAMLLAVGAWLGSRQVMAQWRTPEQLWTYTLHNIEGKGRAYVLGVLGSYYGKRHRYEEALQANKDAHEAYSAPYIYPLLAASLLSGSLARNGESAQWWDKLLDESPGPADVLFEYGRFQFQHGNFSRAELYLTKAVERNRSHPTVNPKQIYLYLGLTQSANGHYDQSLESLSLASLSQQDKTNICKWLAQPHGRAKTTDDSSGPQQRNPLLAMFCGQQ